MSWLTDIFAGDVADVVKETGDAIDKVFTSDEERLRARNAFKALEVKLAEIADQADARRVEAERFIQEELTKRHQADMMSDSWLSKNVRPLVVIYLTFGLTAALVNGTRVESEIALKVWESTLDAIVGLAVVVYGYYFGSRGIEKVTALFSKFSKAKK